MFFIAPIKRLKGLRFKLTLIYSTLFGIFIALYGVMTSRHYIENYKSDYDSALLNFAIDLSETIHLDDTGFTTKPLISKAERRKHFPFRLNQFYYTIRSLDGEILNENKDKHIEIPLDKKFIARDEIHQFESIVHYGKTFRAVNLKIRNDSGLEIVLQVATPEDIIHKQEQRHFLINFISIPLLIIVASLLSYLIAGNALLPIKTLIQTVSNIAAQNLSQRVVMPKTGDEVEELTVTFNNLLERLDKSFQAQQHFVANASHQLNTPLAIIKGELEVLKSKERSPQEIKKFHGSLEEELKRLIELVKNMLLISRVESGLDSFVMRTVRIDELIMTTTSRLSLKAKDKKIALKLNVAENAEDYQMEILGEKQLLSALFENLLDNAIKYSPEESVIQIDIFFDQLNVSVSIQDQGPGIDEFELSSILNSRYQRGSTIPIPGTGIGLAIAKLIATHHHSEIQYKRLAPKGSYFCLAFKHLGPKA